MKTKITIIFLVIFINFFSFQFEYSKVPHTNNTNTITFYVGPEKAHAAAVVEAVSSVVNTVAEAVSAVVVGTVGAVLSTVGGIFGTPMLGCQIIGTNGYATFFNNGCPEGSVVTSMASLPSTEVVTGTATCDIGGTIVNASCFTCSNNQTATLPSLCPAYCAVGGLDTTTNTCVNPVVDSVVVTKQPSGGTFTITCTGSNKYKVLKGGVLFASGNYLGTPVNVPVTDDGSYSVICIQGSYESAPFPTSYCAVGGLDTITNTCVNPTVDSVVVTGQYYQSGGNLAITCSGANKYKVVKDGTLFTSGNYLGTPVNVPVTESGNYSVTCIQGNYEGPSVVKYYNAGPPPSAIISITASPRTIAKNTSTILNFNLQFPIASCTLTAKAVCAGDKCTQAQLAYETKINNILKTEKVDSPDPYGVNGVSRSIVSAVKTVVPSHINTDWKTYGKKTLKGIENTTDFTISCGNSKSSVRVLVTQNQER